MKDYKVYFQTAAGETAVVRISETETLLDAAKKAGLPIDAPCSGNGVCGKCKVSILSGILDTDKNHQLSAKESELGLTLACTARPLSDLEVFVPASSIAFSSRIKVENLDELRTKAAFDSFVSVLKESGRFGNHGISLRVVSPEPASLENPAADSFRLLSALGGTGGDCGVSLHALRKLPHMIAEGRPLRCIVDSHESAASSDKDAGFTVLDIIGEGQRILGLAVDIGTTTVSALLADLESGEVLSHASAGNAQVRYGADVINRIIESTRAGGMDRLREALIADSLVPMIEAMCRAAGIDMRDIIRSAFAGNTTMSHLFLGVDAGNIRLEPYVPAFFELCSRSLRSGAVGIAFHPEAELLVAPSVGSYVGGDITAGVFASLMCERDGTSMLIDLGTNGELVIGGRDYLMCCACSAGPAFEGGNISSGMRATQGAIEACTIDEDSLSVSVSVIGEGDQKAAGLCGSGLIDLISEMYRVGIINAKGKIVADSPSVLRDEWGYAAYIIVPADESDTGSDLLITETDIENFIRAKGAIFSAIRTMLEMLGMSPQDIDRIYIAGGIGGSVDIGKAIAIGMLPDIAEDRYSFIGNSSLMGAYAMLMSGTAEAEITAIARRMTYVELSTYPSYMEEFVAACFIPHTDTALFPSYRHPDSGTEGGAGA